MSQRFQKISYRNALYHGQLQNNKHHGVGLLIDQNWLFCLGYWHNNKLDGKCVMIMPDHRIFYGQIHHKKLHDLVVFVLSFDCRLFANYQNGQLIGKACIDFAQLKTILQISNPNNKTSPILVQSQIVYDNPQQKWEIISKVTKSNISLQSKNIYQFIQTNFTKPTNIKFQDLINDSTLFIGLNGNTLGAKINPKNYQIISIGQYTLDKQISGMGFKTINTMSGVIFQQGNYLQPQSIIRYQKRSSQGFKIFRNTLFRSIEFKNFFFGMSNFQQIWDICKDIGYNLAQNQTQKYAQILLENPNPLRFSKVQGYQEQQANNLIRTAANLSLLLKQKGKQNHMLNTALIQEKILNNENKIAQDCSLEKIKQQVYKAAQKRKNSRISPKNIIKQFSPSQLKKTPKKVAQASLKSNNKSQDSLKILSNLDSHERYERKNPKIQSSNQDRIKQLIKQRNISPSYGYQNKNLNDYGKIKDRSYFHRNQTINNNYQQEKNKSFKVDPYSPHCRQYNYKYYGDQKPQRSSSQKKVAFKLNSSIQEQIQSNKKWLQKKNHNFKASNNQKAQEYAQYYDQFVNSSKKQRNQIVSSSKTPISKVIQYTNNRDNLDYNRKLNTSKSKNKYPIFKQSEPISKEDFLFQNYVNQNKKHSPSKNQNYTQLYEKKRNHRQQTNPQNINEQYRQFQRAKLSSYSKKPLKSKQKNPSPIKYNYLQSQAKKQSPIQKFYQKESIIKGNKNENLNYGGNLHRKVYKYF